MSLGLLALATFGAVFIASSSVSQCACADESPDSGVSPWNSNISAGIDLGLGFLKEESGAGTISTRGELNPSLGLEASTYRQASPSAEPAGEWEYSVGAKVGWQAPNGGTSFAPSYDLKAAIARRDALAFGQGWSVSPRLQIDYQQFSQQSLNGLASAMPMAFASRNTRVGWVNLAAAFAAGSGNHPILELTPIVAHSFTSQSAVESGTWSVTAAPVGFKEGLEVAYHSSGKDTLGLFIEHVSLADSTQTLFLSGVRTGLGFRRSF